MIRLNETKFCIHIIIDKNNSMYVGIVKYRYSQICNRVTGMIRLNETKFCIHIIIDKNNSMYVGIVKYRYSQICNRVTALDYTPGIYADGYIVFAFPFVHSSVRMFVCSFVRGICVKVLR